MKLSAITSFKLTEEAVQPAAAQPAGGHGWLASVFDFFNPVKRQEMSNRYLMSSLNKLVASMAIRLMHEQATPDLELPLDQDSQTGMHLPAAKTGMPSPAEQLGQTTAVTGPLQGEMVPQDQVISAEPSDAMKAKLIRMGLSQSAVDNMTLQQARDALNKPKSEWPTSLNRALNTQLPKTQP